MRTDSNGRSSAVLDHRADDIRGWTVRDADGTRIGTVKELLANADTEFVSSAVLEDGRHISAHDLEIGDGVLRLKTTRSAAATAASAQTATSAQTTARGRSEAATRTAATSTAGDIVVQVVDEEIEVGKRRYDDGGVHFESHVVCAPYTQDVRLQEEHVTCERKKVDRTLSADEANKLFHDESYEVTATSQVPVIDKTAHVVEEIVLKKNAVERDQTVRDKVRHMEADVTELRASEAQRGAGR